MEHCTEIESDRGRTTFVQSEPGNNDPQATQLHPNTLQAGLQRTCQTFTTEIGHLADENHSLIQDLLEQNASLREQLQRVQVESSKAQSETNFHKTNYSFLIGDITQICNEKLEICEQLEEEKLQKDLNQLLLDQYRQETVEQKEMITVKERYIQELKESTASFEVELGAIRAQCLYHNQSITVSDEEIATLRRGLQIVQGNLARQQATAGQLRKDRNDAINGCMYYRVQINKCRLAKEAITAKLKQLKAITGSRSVGTRRRRAKKRRRRAL